jgi:hypothetical protein
MLYPLSYEGGALNVPRNRRSEVVRCRTPAGEALGSGEVCPLGAQRVAIALPDVGPRPRVRSVRERL